MIINTLNTIKIIQLYKGKTNTIIESIIIESLYYTVRIIYRYKPRANKFKVRTYYHYKYS